MVAKKRGTRGSSIDNCGDEGPEEPPPEDPSSPPDYREMLLEAMPVLEWVSAKGSGAGPKLQDEARRAIIRFYIAQTRRPALAKAKSS